MALLAACHPRSGDDGRAECRADDQCPRDQICDRQECIRWWKLSGRVAEVNADELEEMLNGPNPPQLIDVRTQAEWELGHIEGAVNVPLGQLEEQQDFLPFDQGEPVVAICLTAHRSIPTVRLLQRHGYEAVQLKGGMLAWRKQGKREVRRRR